MRSNKVLPFRILEFGTDGTFPVFLPGLRPDTSRTVDGRGRLSLHGHRGREEQQVPPLRRRVRSGFGRNDRGF
jgi:hypothetical protein